MNRDLKGYSVQLPGLHVQLIGLSLTLKGLTVLQQAHPDPPIVYFPVLKASIHWREILSGRLVAELRLDQPKININLQQLRNEAASKVPLKERGWQQAVEDIYPLKINTLKINDASITYIDQDPKRPLVLSHLNLQATNIRNIHLPDQVYPSSFHLDTAIFGTGHGSIDGDANFLAEPYPGIKGRLKLEKVPIDYFNTVIARSNLSIHGGVLRGLRRRRVCAKCEKRPPGIPDDPGDETRLYPFATHRRRRKKTRGRSGKDRQGAQQQARHFDTRRSVEPDGVHPRYGE